MKRTILLLLTLLPMLSIQAIEFTLNGLKYSTSGEEAKVSYYIGNPTTVVIPETVTYDGTTYTVTSIGERCFMFCYSLTSIVIPNSVTSIGYDCFYGCHSLTSIVIPNSVTSFGYHCFYNCSSLTSIVIPNSVTSIDDACFDGCSSLISIVIPNSVTSIGSSCFSFCIALTSIVIPNSVTSLGGSCFYNCWNLTSIDIPNSVTSIGNACFSDCRNLTSIDIPNSVTSIGSYCFDGCESLKSLTIEDGEKTITLGNSGVFYNCPLERVYLGRPFSYSTSSTSDYSPFYNNKNLKTISLGSSVTSLGDYCFSGCSGLESIWSYAEKPPTLGTNVFNGVDKFDCQLYVPENCVDRYKFVDGWKEFFYINGFDASQAIVDIAADDIDEAEQPVEVYNLSGIKVYQGLMREARLASGIYIVRQGSATFKINR